MIKELTSAPSGPWLVHWWTPAIERADWHTRAMTTRPTRMCARFVCIPAPDLWRNYPSGQGHGCPGGSSGDLRARRDPPAARRPRQVGDSQQDEKQQWHDPHFGAVPAGVMGDESHPP